jgi:hypothetical protein
VTFIFFLSRLAKQVAVYKPKEYDVVIEKAAPEKRISTEERHVALDGTGSARNKKGDARWKKAESST